MTVLFLSRRFSPHLGGVEKHLKHLCQELQKNSPQEFKIQAVTEQDQADLAEHEFVDGVEVFRIPLTDQKTNKKQIWDWWWRHQQLLQDADIVHIHDVFFWLLPLRLRYFFKPWFITFHGYEPPGPPNWRQRAWHQLAELLTQANICIGGFHQKWYGVKPDQVSFGAVEVNSRRVTQSNSQKKHNLIFVGRLEEDTGVFDYIRALQTLGSNEVRLDIYGGGPLENELKNFVKAHHLPVTFFGQTNITTELYQQYLLSCVSGYLTILESLAAGVPVVATFRTELKKDYLLLTPFAKWITVVEGSDAKQLGAEISAEHSLSADAVNWAQSQSWEKLADQYQILWRGALKDSKKSN